MEGFEVVFSGRGFIDGRGLSSMSAGWSSSAALLAREGVDYDDDGQPVLTWQKRRNQRRQERRRLRTLAAVAAAQTNAMDDAPTICRCGCGGQLPPRGHRSGRQRLFLPLHRCRIAWRRTKAAIAAEAAKAAA